MADDLSKKGPADRSRINLLEPYEVQYWADKFGVSKERLSEAVHKGRSFIRSGWSGIDKGSLR